jgi:hypothetical protein
MTDEELKALTEKYQFALKTLEWGTPEALVNCRRLAEDALADVLRLSTEVRQLRQRLYPPRTTLIDPTCDSARAYILDAKLLTHFQGPIIVANNLEAVVFDEALELFVESYEKSRDKTWKLLDEQAELMLARRGIEDLEERRFKRRCILEWLVAGNNSLTRTEELLDELEDKRGN